MRGVVFGIGYRDERDVVFYHLFTSKQCSRESHYSVDLDVFSFLDGVKWQFERGLEFGQITALRTFTSK